MKRRARLAFGEVLGRLRALREDETGAVGAVVAAMGVALIGAAGIALDVGLYYSSNRNLRAATEAAALAAAMKPGDASNIATQYLIKNGYDGSIIKSVEVGYYCANIDPKYPAGSRFVTSMNLSDCPGSSVQNAVRLTTGKASRRYLTSVFGGASPIPDLSATASAARIDEAGIAVTSGLLTVTNSLVDSVNNLLGALIGWKLILSSTQIEALMGGNVDAGKFFDSLATRTSQSSTTTYNQMLQGTYSLQNIAYAAADAAYSTNTATVLRTVGDAGGSYQVPMANMFGLGVWKNMPVGSASVDPGPTLRAGLNAYQLVAYAAQAGPGVINASDLVNFLTNNTAAPGSTVKVTSVVSGALDRPRFSFGPTGETRVGTSMLRLQVDIDLVNLGISGVIDAKATVPLVVDVAAAEAELTAIDCAGQTEQSTQTTATIHAKSGLVNIYLGKPKSNVMTKSMPTVSDNDFDRADIFSLTVLGLGLSSVKGKVVVPSVLAANDANVMFGPGGSGTIGTASAAGQAVVVGNKFQVGNVITTLTGKLLASNNLEVCTLILCVAPSSGGASDKLSLILGKVGTILSSTTDPLLDNVLAALGVQLGHATVWVNGARCGVPVLV